MTVFLRHLLVCLAFAGPTGLVQAETPRQQLLEIVGSVPFTAERIRSWAPLVAEFGNQVFSEWEQGLYFGAIDQHVQARQWLINAAVKGNTPDPQKLCLAYKLARGTEPQNNDDPFGEKHKANIAEQQISDWYRTAATKQAKKQALKPEEKAAWAAGNSLPDGDAGNQVAQQRLVVCRNLSDAPDPTKLFRHAIAAGRPLPGYAINYLANKAEADGQLNEAGKLYDRALAAGFAPAAGNLIRLKERQMSPAPGDRAWEDILLGYRKQAELGDGRSMIYLADLMERGSSGPANIDIALLLYMQGIDAGNNKLEFNEGMSYVFLALYAQERLTEYHAQGRLKLNDKERRQYLGIRQYLEQKKEAPPSIAKP